MEAFWCLLLKSVRRFWHLWHLGVGFCRLSFSFSVEIVFVFNVVSDLWLQPGHLGVLVWDRILFKSLSRTSFLWRSRGDRGQCCLITVGQGCNPGSPPSFLGICCVGVSSLLGLCDFTLPGKGGVLPCSCWVGVESRFPSWPPLTQLMGAHCHLMGMDFPNLLWHYQVRWGWATVFSVGVTTVGLLLSKNVMSC